MSTGASGGTAAGRLVLVATPIGNVRDLSPRAADVLRSADVVCCEDTRHSGRLFSRLGITTKRLLSLHGHNEAQRTEEVLRLLEDGLTVALVTDAGTPAVSDPGARVVAAAHEAGAVVSIVPGPSAAVAAVAVAGLSAERWCFEGFLPRKGAERTARLAAIAAAPQAVVIYEAPGRVDALVADLASACGGDRLVAVCRELTKLHEQLWRGPLSLAAGLWPADSARGEFVLVLDAARAPAPAEVSPGELAAAVERLMASGLTRRDAVAEAAERAGIARREVYDALAQSGPAAS